MASISGFTVLPYGHTALGTFPVPGTGVRLSLRREVAPLLLALARDFHTTVEPLDPKSCWGHAHRRIAGTDVWSRHAPGIAIDLNASAHPMGRRGTFSSGEVAAIRALLKRYRHTGRSLFRWGGDFDRADDMHFELIADRSVCLAAVTALQAPPATMAATTHPGGHRPGSRMLRYTTPPLTGDDVRHVQRWVGPARCGPADGEFGPRTSTGVKWYQRLRGLPADGIVGRNTWRHMGVTYTGR